jgi:hypothetical protein
VVVESVLVVASEACFLNKKMVSEKSFYFLHCVLLQ